MTIQTTWGSRAGADASDNERMVRQQKEEYSYRSEKAFMGEKLPLTHEFTKSHSQALAAWVNFSMVLGFYVVFDHKDFAGIAFVDTIRLFIWDWCLGFVHPIRTVCWLGWSPIWKSTLLAHIFQFWPQRQCYGRYGRHSSRLVVTGQSDNCSILLHFDNWLGGRILFHTLRKFMMAFTLDRLIEYLGRL